MNYPTRRPFSSFSNAHRGGDDTIVKAATALMISTADGLREHASKIAAREWGKQSDPAILLRAAVTPTATSSTGGGDMFVQSAVSEFLTNLAPASAGSVLLQRGLQLRFGEFGAISVPNYVMATGSTAFVAEGAPIPARQLSLDCIALSPDKFASILTFTHEMLTGSMPNVTSVVGSVLTESVGLHLDSATLDTNVATTTRPAGLRAGITVTAHEATATGGGNERATLGSGVCTENSILVAYMTESPNVSGDDRSLMLLPDPARLCATPKAGE
jgi:HK97 family phage major capsid protein